MAENIGKIMSLKRWQEENWVDDKGNPCGTAKDSSGGPRKCRPSKRVSSDTPKTWGEMSKSEKTKAVRDKSEANKKNEQFGKVRFSRLKAKTRGK